MNTRRYHGLLCDATLPPVGRVMTVNRIGELLMLDEKPDPMLEFSVNAFRGQLHPRGDRYLTRFDLGTTARWEYDVNGVQIVKELQLVWKKNAAAVRYTVNSGDRAFRLSLLPMVSLRDFHVLRRAGSASFRTESAERRVTVGEGPFEVTISSDAGSFTQQPDWWYGQIYPIEAERGQDDSEDLFTPGRFVLAGSGTASITLWIGMEKIEGMNWDQELGRRKIVTSKSLAVGRLLRAADDFVVTRKSPDGTDGTTVIAGYPWFADWGRDTMISLPGLLLVHRAVRGGEAVLAFSRKYVSQGMIPNRFDDYTNEPSYNTVDASLWFIHAAFEYRADVSGDAEDV